jgi:hypothetical protein
MTSLMASDCLWWALIGSDYDYDCLPHQVLSPLRTSECLVIASDDLPDCLSHQVLSPLRTSVCLVIAPDDLMIASLIRCSGRRQWRVGFGHCQTSPRVTRPSVRAPSGRL